MRRCIVVNSRRVACLEIMIDPHLTNKVVLITGANHGIGAATAKAFAAQAAKVFIAYYRDAAESARKNRDALDRAHVRVPVLGISSSHGSIPDMAASLRPWADNTDGVVIPGAGHYIPEEQPAEEPVSRRSRPPRRN